MSALTLRVANLALAALACALTQLAPAQSPLPAPPTTAKPAATSAVPRKLMPVDEGSTDASWVQFRSGLLESLRRGDRRALAGIIDANILNPLESPRGIAAFRKMWDLDGKDEHVTRDLSAMLQLGSAWYQPKKGARLLCAPYVPIKWPLEDVDPYSNGAIVIKDALIKDAPSHSARTLGSLNYDIVEVGDWEVADKEDKLQQRWVKIRHQDRDGYVPYEHIRSAIEYRACFAITPAGWRLMEYVIGIEYLGSE
ncbi:MAG TPA: hypothetical protein VK663_09930 [Burkholderiales bacterium]|nr:hypothetical protein [Burkholderiales bacterium]